MPPEAPHEPTPDQASSAQSQNGVLGTSPGDGLNSMGPGGDYFFYQVGECKKFVATEVD